MNIEKEREAFEVIPENVRLLRGAKFSDGKYVAISLFDDSSKECATQLNYGWSIWKAHALRAEVKLNKDFDEFFTKRHGSLPVDTTSEKYADMSYLKHEMNKSWNMATVKLEGCVVVPVEPTDEMLEKGYRSINHGMTNMQNAERIYKAMVEAARGGNE